MVARPASLSRDLDHTRKSLEAADEGYYPPVPSPQHAEQRIGDLTRQLERAHADIRQGVRQHDAVAKLKAARERKKAATGKCEGRKSHAELRPEVVELAKQLRRKRPEQLSYREIAAELLAAGHANSKGRPFSASAIA